MRQSQEALMDTGQPRKVATPQRTQWPEVGANRETVTFISSVASPHGQQSRTMIVEVNKHYPKNNTVLKVYSFKYTYIKHLFPSFTSSATSSHDDRY